MSAGHVSSCERHGLQIPFPLNCITWLSLPQNVQESVILRRMMLPPSTAMYRWSPSRMLNMRLVSAGMTIRPRSSILRAIPESTARSLPIGIDVLPGTVADECPG